jgi:glycosyltransferase involved in cell wall biosynthesis
VKQRLTVFPGRGRTEPPHGAHAVSQRSRKGADDGVEALALVQTRAPDVRIRICGTVRPDRLSSWIGFDFHPGDAGLRHRYSTSTAFLYPSRYEGFGLPPLKSMACPIAD